MVVCELWLRWYWWLWFVLWSTGRTSAGQDPGAGISGVEFSTEEIMIEFSKMSFDGLETIGGH